MADGVPVFEMIRDLSRVKLSRHKLNFVKSAKALFEKRGSIPVKTRAKLRKIYSEYISAIKELHEANERARISMAREAMGLNESEVKERRKQRLENDRKKLSDLGF